MSGHVDLFEEAGARRTAQSQPLAARMRPRTLEEIAGQDHILGPGKLLRRAIEADRLSSLILYGPPGCGKTSLAEVIASVTSRAFVAVSGVTANVAELRVTMRQARQRRGAHDRETTLFIDEIHRFNKAQQDVLLPFVEDGTVTLIGATTHNPQFFINSPLTSRSLVFELQTLSESALAGLLRRALRDPRGLADRRVSLDEAAVAHLARESEGDARRALNALEIAALTTPPGGDGCIRITVAEAAESIQKKVIVYDHDEHGHYDAISAFIKSVRGSDPDAAVYWLAKMLYAGEDPRFIARRLVILASEDIGNADPRGLTVAVSAMHAAEFVGMPEARIVLAQATTYLATAPKSNAAYMAVEEAGRDVARRRTLDVPERLKNVKVRAAGKSSGPQDVYRYPHDYAVHYVEQAYLPEYAHYYRPTDQGYEERIASRMARWRAQRAAPPETASPGESDDNVGGEVP